MPRDALQNWSQFERIRPQLIDALRSYKANPGQRYTITQGVRYLNPDYTLTSFLWRIGEQSSESLYLIDFEERHQKCFLRRGLIIYCEFILRGLEAAPPEDPRQLKLALRERERV